MYYNGQKVGAYYNGTQVEAYYNGNKVLETLKIPQAPNISINNNLTGNNTTVYINEPTNNKVDHYNVYTDGSITTTSSNSISVYTSMYNSHNIYVTAVNKKGESSQSNTSYVAAAGPPFISYVSGYYDNYSRQLAVNFSASSALGISSYSVGVFNAMSGNGSNHYVNGYESSYTEPDSPGTYNITVVAYNSMGASSTYYTTVSS